MGTQLHLQCRLSEEGCTIYNNEEKGHIIFNSSNEGREAEWTSKIQLDAAPYEVMDHCVALGISSPCILSWKSSIETRSLLYVLEKIVKINRLTLQA